MQLELKPSEDIYKFDGDDRDFRSLTSLREGILRASEVAPRESALWLNNQEFTFEELLETSARWAACLLESTNGRCKRVGIFAHRDQISYFGVVASLLAGATFVPLNPKNPHGRNAQMIAQANLDAILVDKFHAQELLHLFKEIPLRPVILAPNVTSTIRCDSDQRFITSTSIDHYAPLKELPIISPLDYAYIMFTSGSTGIPKAIPITHKNVCAFLDANSERYRFTSEDRFTQTFEQTFDLSIFDLFMAWKSTSCVYSLHPLELLAPVNFINRHQISVWFSVPSVGNLLKRRGVLRPGCMPSLRLSLFCGESMHVSLAEDWQLAAPNSVIENLYGPTELTIACASYKWNSKESPTKCLNGTVPIGNIYSRHRAVIVDENLEEVLEGESGELCVAGPQVFDGYLDSTCLNEEKFFVKASQNPIKYYRTGDIVCYRNSELHFLGRTDRQVKVGGHRIELSDVESALRRLGCVLASAFGWPSDNNPEYLLAAIDGPVDPVNLRRALSLELPIYMIPKEIFQISLCIPVNANGKVDQFRLRQEVFRLHSMPHPSEQGTERASN